MTYHLPLIGITTYARNENNEVNLPTEYADAVRRAGGLPVLVPPGETHPDVLIKRLDGLILAGGGDIDPATYGGSTHETIYMVDGERDTMELALARWAVETGTPVLAICRGAQVVNVALGGTLLVHLPDVVGEQVRHRLPPREPIPHPVQITPGSRLAELFPEVTTNPMSWHHQAVCEVAEPLEVVARAADGVIEGLEHPGHPWLIAVQWHPELTAVEDPGQQHLFDDFVRAAQQQR